MDPYKGGAKLGAALFGDGSGAYDKQVRAAALGESAIEQARRNRSLALIDAARLNARQNLTADLISRAQAGDTMAQGELGAAALGSNSTVNLGQLGDYQQPHFGEASNIAFDALGLGEEPADISLANRARAYIKQAEYQPIRAEGGAYIADGTTLGDDFHVIPTPTSLATIQAKEAASARADRKAAQPRATKSAKPLSGEALELSNARAAIQAGADPAAVAEMLSGRGYPALAKKVYTQP